MSYPVYELLPSAPKPSPKGQFLETALIAVVGNLDVDNFADGIISMIGTLNMYLEISL